MTELAAKVLKNEYRRFHAAQDAKDGIPWNDRVSERRRIKRGGEPLPTHGNAAWQALETRG